MLDPDLRRRDEEGGRTAADVHTGIAHFIVIPAKAGIQLRV